MNTLAPLVMALLMVSSLQLQARPIHYGAVESEAVKDCDSLQWQGKLQEAESCYTGLISADQPLEIQAEAVWALGDPQAANNLFSQASRSVAADEVARASQILTRWGDLYAATYQLEGALDLYTEANELDPDNEQANLGAATVLLESFDPSAGDYLIAVAADANKNPGVQLKATLLLAYAAIQAGELNDAEDMLAEAEKLAERGDFPLLEIYALKAAIDVHRRIDPQPWIEKALAINPYYGDAYAIPAHFYVITFRYDEAGDFYQKAVDLQPDHWNAHLELGANHLRQNRPSLARIHFELAYSGDPFHPEAVNSMRLMDTYDGMDIVNFPEVTESPIPEVSLRLDKAERDLLAPYASQLALEAIESFSERYDFKLKETASIEIYPNHDDFIVRALGMPGTALLGVAFGYLVAMDSPTARAGRDYHWGTTLWHEVAHIFTLEASNHRVPRWFSEGISVYEEWHTGPLAFWKRISSINGRDLSYPLRPDDSLSEEAAVKVSIPLHVYGSLMEEEFLPIDKLDRGFVRPTYENQVLVSYNQAGLVCTFIAQEYGHQALVDMLYAYGRELTTSQVIEEVLGMSTDDFDQQFVDYFETNHGHILNDLNEWVELRMLASAALKEENWSAAIEAADEAIALMPDYTEADSAYLLKARALESLESLEKLDDSQGSSAKYSVLETFWQKGGYQPDALMELALHYRQAGQAALAMEVLNAINLVDPFKLDVHMNLGDLLLEQGKTQRALQEYQVAMALNPLDKASVYYRLGNTYHQMGQIEQARQQTLAALDIAPHYRPAQKLLVELLNN